jgi:diguanylate cyclase (GGDEF)-like protein
MRLATITNWAYGATVVLTFVSGMTMLLASNAQQRERAAVEQRYELDKATSKLGDEIYALTDRARQYLNTGDQTYLVVYRSDAAALRSVEDRVRHIGDAGATEGELAALKEAVRWTDTLHDEQRTAIIAYGQGDEARARQLLFGAEYERELDRAESLFDRFQDRLDQRIGAEVAAATQLARLWKAISETVLGTTGLLFLCVLYFVFKQRVLRPVVRLSDVVNRLAAQDYAVETPDYGQIDEIGDMAQAIRVFRENGLERQRLEAERDVDRVVRDLLSRMTQRMQGCDTLLDLREVIQRFIPEIAPGLAGRLYLLDPARNAVVEACSWLGPIHSLGEFSPIACWALRRGLPHRPAGRDIDVPCDHLALVDGSLIDTLCLPLTAQRETLGLLYFEPRPGASAAAEPRDVYLRMLAENVGLALANLRLRDALREMALADPLTGLANRRQLDAVLDLQLAESERLGQPISCLMIDVDHFKRFNDMFGHEAGDAVLREVGAVLKGGTRELGSAFRYGGEEFLLLLAGMDPDQASARAEDIRARMAALRVEHGGSELGSITVSIGLASAPAHCRIGELVQTADAALLRAKALGRDRVVAAIPRRDRSAA